MIVDWPNELVQDIARRHSALVLGAGISSQSKNASGQSPKRWAEFLKAAKKAIGRRTSTTDAIQNLIDSRDYLTACEVIRIRLGPARFADLVRSEFLTPQFQPAQIHDSIISLDSRLVITPNFDKIYETRANTIAHGSVQVKQYYSVDVVEAIRNPLPVIVKNHGSVDEPAKIIFTRNDYAAAREENKNFHAIMDAVALTHTFLFLGCGLDDPDIRLMLESYAFRHKFGRPHYFVLPRHQLANCVRDVIESSMNIRILTYDPRPNHALLKTALDELRAEVDAARLTLQSHLSW